eukprot:CAMPEP_0196583112 /NCGR_PEP_ID=MMETSP1081-20130531/42039_1 /TAXON_ID=36882 /ORGANISM="Pyramimonas amylifera, Strain CCMP720" /LENGTH=111 /DNA_ID=CAMNT_0041903883 /DNA_START=77 /DNA_END=412 /DNA_ORIENTATION=+
MAGKFKSSFVAGSGGIAGGTAAQIVAPKTGWKVSQAQIDATPIVSPLAPMMGLGGMALPPPPPLPMADPNAAAASAQAAARISAMIASRGNASAGSGNQETQPKERKSRWG